jgi:hypothetical protein
VGAETEVGERAAAHRARANTQLRLAAANVLCWHFGQLDAENQGRAARAPELARAMDESELLFRPNRTGVPAGAVRFTSCLDKKD